MAAARAKVPSFVKKEIQNLEGGGQGPLGPTFEVITERSHYPHAVTSSDVRV